MLFHDYASIELEEMVAPTPAWMVAAFGIVVVPLGAVSIYFIIIQPIVIGTWCTLCLIAGAAMVLMIPYTLDELVAMGQFLVQSHRRGEPFWHTFLTGGASPGSGLDQRPDFDAPLGSLVASALRGVQVPWTLVACAILGGGLMFTRPIFGTELPAATVAKQKRWNGNATATITAARHPSIGESPLNGPMIGRGRLKTYSPAATRGEINPAAFELLRSLKFSTEELDEHAT